MADDDDDCEEAALGALEAEAAFNLTFASSRSDFNRSISAAKSTINWGSNPDASPVSTFISDGI